MLNLSVGSDPELMLIDKNNQLKSAIGIVNGTKTEKIDLGDGNLLFYDNVLAEVNIRPGKSADELVGNVNNCLRKLSKAVYPFRLHLQASATYPAAECKHPDALVFGCEPEFDAYAMNIVQAPECKTTFRSAGGHIHLGQEEGNWPLTAPADDDGGFNRAWGRIWVVRMMDLFVGIPSLWIDQDPHSPARRKLYGKAGTHRQKEEYGVEYRSTSNFWLRSPTTVKLIYDLSSFVVDFVGNNLHKELWKEKIVKDEDGFERVEYDCVYSPTILQAAINNSDKKEASAFLNGYVKKYLPSALYGQILAASEPVQVNLYQQWGL